MRASKPRRGSAVVSPFAQDDNVVLKDWWRVVIERPAMLRRVTLVVVFALCAQVTCIPARAALPLPFARLDHDIRVVAHHVRAAIGLDVLDLNTGYNAGYNAGRSMPAASTIKLPVMVAVFEQLQAGRIDVNTRVTLQARDKDCGSGDLCGARIGQTFPVSELLAKMIDISDNTATNMLIRLVGRRNINRSMTELGLEHTHLAGDVRTADWTIRRMLRTSAGDLVHLLSMMARGELVDQWSSNEMIALLKADRINTLLPAPLPDNVAIAHKTGSLFDTLNDAGIVYAADSPYVIAVMTTALPSQDLGRSFIHTVSRLAYADELQFARWRHEMGISSSLDAPPSLGAQPASSSGNASPDVPYWNVEGPPPNR
jgi:beta-lactamase class A